MSSEMTSQWVDDVTTSNVSDLFDNGTWSLDNETLTGDGADANTILAADTIKIIYLVIGQSQRTVVLYMQNLFNATAKHVIHSRQGRIPSGV